MLLLQMSAALLLGACGAAGSGGVHSGDAASLTRLGAGVGAVSEPRLSSKEAIKIIGIEVRTSNSLEADPSKARIPGLWKRFFEDGIAEKVKSQRNPGVIYATYTHYEGDYRGEYDLIVGCEVNHVDNVPAGMVSITIPAARYLLFTANGKMPKALIDTWEEVWRYFSESGHAKRAYTADFELHRADRPDEVQIYVALK